MGAALAVRRAVAMRRALLMRSMGMAMLVRFQVLPHQRPASTVAHDLLVAHAVALADRPLRGMDGPLALAGGVVTRCRMARLRAVVARRRVTDGCVTRRRAGVRPVMSRRAIIVIEPRRRRRNERRGQLRLRCRRRRLRRGRGLPWRGLGGNRLVGCLLCSKRRGQNHECRAGKDDTSHDNLSFLRQRLCVPDSVQR